jgi:MoxR-like ATPase
MRSSFLAFMTYLCAAFPERREVIRGSVLSLLCGEHVLLLGPPGTAKSALVRAFVAWLSGATYFEMLMTKFSTPEEVFGPVSLKALENDRFERVLSGKLATVHVAFVDEVFKANSAILNSMLAVMNERVFHNGGPVVCPLVSMFGASNELPEGKELEAMFDRFMLRFEVGYIRSNDSMRGMLSGKLPPLPAPLSLADLATAQAEVSAVRVTDATVDALLAIREAGNLGGSGGFTASDRRWKKILKLAQASAWLVGDAETSPEDLSFLADALWREPKERGPIAAVVGKLCDPCGSQAVEILDAAREAADRVNALRSADREGYVTAAASTLKDFKAQATKLDNLAAGAGKRSAVTINDAKAEIEIIRKGLARDMSTALNLPGGR